MSRKGNSETNEINYSQSAGCPLKSAPRKNVGRSLGRFLLQNYKVPILREESASCAKTWHVFSVAIVTKIKCLSGFSAVLNPAF